MLSVEQVRTRLAFDYRVVRHMNGSIFDAEAYATTDDLAHRRDPITGDEGEQAKKYRVRFRVPTLIGPGSFAPETEIGFDLGVREYPTAEPLTWVLSDHLPFSPHFKAGAPICLGEIWAEARGHMLLGSLLVHVARLLNWDEVARGGGYVGWNRAAIAYHAEHFRGRPLNPDLRYPSLPLELTHGLSSEPLFSATRAVAAARQGLFVPTGRARP